MSDKNWFYNFISDVSVSVDTGKLRTYSTQLSGVCKNSEKIAARIAKICKNFDSVNAIRTVNNGASIVKKCKQYIDFTASAFEDTENYLSKINPTDIKAIRYGMVTAGLSDDPSSRAVAKLNSNARKITDPGKNHTVGISYSAKLYSKDNDIRSASYIKKTDLKTGDAIIVSGKWQKYEKGKTPQDILDQEWGTDEEKKAKKIEKDISLFSASHTFLNKSSKELGDQSSWFSGKVLQREAHISGGAGYNTKKGWYVEGEIGGSISALKGTLKGSWMGDTIKGSVNAEVGTVSGSLSGGWSQKEGFHAGASLEADIVKVGVTGGISVLGVDAEASANVKVGFGAHANIGIKKGVVTCDIGAAFGLGFDVKIKVDLKKPVKAVKKAAKAAWRKIKRWF